MPPRKPPTDDESALFVQALADARPLKRAKPVKGARPVAAPAAKPERPPPPRSSQPAPPKPLEATRPPPLEPGAAIGLDRRTAEKLKRGQLPIDARIDLHGHTLNDAFAALEHCILNSSAAGRRCILVVTGKGLAGGGALKREVPHWLNLPALRDLVLAFTPSQPRDGGDGALYVLLRRRRD